MRLSLRTRLLGVVVGSILLFFVILVIAVRASLSSDLRALADRQVSGGNSAFAASIASRQEQLRNILGQAAVDPRIGTAIESHKSQSAKEAVQGLQQPNGLTWLTILDAHGNVVARANGIDSGHVDSPLVRAALKGTNSAGIVKLDANALAGELLAEDAAPLKEAAGVAAAVPIVRGGKLIGALYGGNLFGTNSKLVSGVSKSTGGIAQVLLADRVASTSLSGPDGNPQVDVKVPDASTVLTGQPYSGMETLGGVLYYAQISPFKDAQGKVIGGLWYGIPASQIAAVQSHATNSILLYGLLGVLIAVAIAAVIVQRTSSAIIEQSEQVSSSAKALDVIVVGTEVSNDHIMQTRDKLQTVEQLMERVVPVTGADAAELHKLAKEATSDIVVIDTLAAELNDRMRGAVDRVAELNDVATRLARLVHGSRN